MNFNLWAQSDSLTVETEDIALSEKPQTENDYDPLAPARAAFYSAVLPGLGQAYNGKYWKIPLVYAGLGLGVFSYLKNDKEYDRFRDAYKRRLAGFEDDEFQGLLENDALIEAQKHYQRQKEIWLFVTVGFYVLNIIDANVDAHLQQFNVSKDLSLKPNMQFNPVTGKNQYGLSLSFGF